MTKTTKKHLQQLLRTLEYGIEQEHHEFTLTTGYAGDSKAGAQFTRSAAEVLVQFLREALGVCMK